MAYGPSLHNIMFLDIETVSQHEQYHDLPDQWRTLWDTKADGLLKHHEGETRETIYPRAAIYAEFGKIICISCGILQGNTPRKILLKSFASEEEREVLLPFIDMLNKWWGGEPRYLCAHNGKEFDFPYLCRRMIVNALPIPPILQIAGKKPWEVPHFDTLEMWKFGDYKNYTSLNLLAQTLGISTPKDDIDGSRVGEVFWKEKDLPRIVTYCQKDVITVAQIFLRLNGEPLLESSQIEIKT